MIIDFWLVEKYRREAFAINWPIITSSGDPKEEARNISAPQVQLYFSQLPNHQAKILDVGAGEQNLKDAIKQRNIDAQYYSMDTSTNSGQLYNYQNIESISGTYDLIVMQEVIEHLDLETGLQYLKKAYDMLNPNGFLVVTVPNMFRPVQFFTGFSHITHYPLPDLYGILRAIGFKGEAILRRIEIKPRGLSFKDKIMISLRKIIYKIMGFDYAHGVMCMIGK